MNDVAATLGQPAMQAGAGNPASGFGASLQEARKRAGLTVEEVALRLRLHPKQLVALEAEQLDVLPATPFVSGFVRNCAREFGVEPGPLLDDLNAKLAARGLLGPTLDLRGPDVSRMPVLDERRWRQLVMTVIIGVLVCAGLIGAWMARNHGPGSRLAGHQLPKLPAEAPAAAPQPAPADASMPASLAAGMPASLPASPVPGVGTAAEAVQAAPNPALTGAAPAAASNAPAGAARTGAGESTTAPTGAARPGTTGLVLRFNDRSWVEVTQPDGRVLMSHTGEPGSLELLNSAAPMQLVVGRADAVEVEYRGQPVNLKPYVNGNGVARLTLADGRISGGGSNSK